MSVLIKIPMPQNCYECRFCETYLGHHLCVAFLNYIAEPRSGRLDTCPLEEEPEPKYAGWIPCKKQMPKPNEVVGDVDKYYLVQNEFGDMMVASYNAEGDARWWEQMYQYGAIHDEIVAWMELPYEYKAGGEALWKNC